MRNRSGCFMVTIGIVVTLAGIFLWQLGSDSPEWNLSTLSMVVGLIAIVLGAGATLFGFLRMAKR